MYLRVPFASGGDRASIPVDTQPDGSVSYTEGFGFDYQREQGVDPNAKDVPRDQTNDLFYQIMVAVKQYQETGFPPWITAAENGGVSFPYAKNVVVLYSDGNLYQSLVDTNTATPGTDFTKWAAFPPNGFSSADVVETYNSTLPAGWLWVDGRTIGSAASGATSRANADTLNLFTALWNSVSNAVLPIQNSDGTAGARGVSAAADFAANKRLPLIDRRGTVAAGKDNLGGTSANRLTGQPGGVSGTVLGAIGGSQTHSLTPEQGPEHDHLNGVAESTGNSNPLVYTRTTQGMPGNSTAPVGEGTPGNQVNQGTTSFSGSGDPHNNVQPTTVALFRIKL